MRWVGARLGFVSLGMSQVCGSGLRKGRKDALRRHMAWEGRLPSVLGPQPMGTVSS